MPRTLTARPAMRAHNSARARNAASVALAIAVCSLASARPATAQTVSRAFINLFSGAKLFVDPASSAKRQADAWRNSRPSDAALMDKIAAQPLAQWMGGWNVDIGRDVSSAVSRITGANALPVFVAYNIPNRDCGQYSAGGAGGADAYKRWIRSFATGIEGRGAIVVLEPDALALTNCLSEPARAERFALLRDAVQQLEAQGAGVYLDAGH